MRISSKSTFIPYQRNLEMIQDRRFKEEIRIATGKDIVNLGDAPDRIQDVKKLRSIITNNEKYISINEQTIGELLSVENKIEALSDKVRQVRQLAIDATQTGNTGGLESLAAYVKGIMEDMVNVANSDFNGKMLFSGTQTSPNSITPTGDQQNNMPFEIIEGETTAENPSGLRVEFKGNYKDRIINRDSKTTEVINTTADSLFGEEGVATFNTIIELYNLLKYDDNDELRGFFSVFSSSDVGKINELQQTLAEFDNRTAEALGINGTVYSRLDELTQQMVNENLRLKEFLSKKEDTDIAKSTLNYKLEENALNYSLQVGSRLLRTTLFDFLR